ncbi:2'-5' RNA ligase family protein [Streptomyces sp. URMC 125]|uniref:2'-5' RNA ligase family protein n=1 Tax=Streptomyces sp. URMC 125 TaxID=3423419 RepID=UPI003F1C083F
MIAAHDWAAFGTVREMADHWDRPGWNAATRAYYWMLTFPDAPSLIDRSRQCQNALRHLGFDDVDEDGLHLTLGRIGPVGEVRAGRLDSLVAAARERHLGAFTLRAVPLTASRGAIRYSVAPWTPVVELHAALSATGADTGLPLRRPTSALRPHISIAYCNRRVSADTVRDALRPLRGTEAVEVPVGRVDLVELRREGRAYRWEVIHELALR